MQLQQISMIVNSPLWQLVSLRQLAVSLFVWISCAVTILLVSGCGKKDSPTSERSIVTTDTAPTSVEDDDDSRTIERLLDAAGEAIQRQDWATAREKLRQVLLIDPTHSAALVGTANVEARMGNFVAALEVLESVDPQDPEFGIASLMQAAKWLADSGSIQKAKQKYSLAISLAPNDETLSRQYAHFLNQVGWRYEANQVLSELVEAGKATELELRAMLDLSNSYAAAAATGWDKPVRREGPLSKALGLISSRQPREAKKVLDNLIASRIMVGDAAVDAAFAAVHADLQQFKDVDDIIRGADRSIERYPLYWRAIGDRFVFQNLPEPAAGAYLKSLTLDATNQVSHERMMAVLLQLGNVELARAVDDRRALLLTIQQSAAFVGAGQPYDLPAGLDLLQALEEAGEPLQAAAWLEHLLRRHEPANESDLQSHLSRIQGWRDMPSSVSSLTRRSGIPESMFPIPNVELLATAKPFGSSILRSNVDRTVAKFVDVAPLRGLNHQYKNASPEKRRQFQIHQALGAGVAALDYDRNGLVDFYCGQGGCNPPQETSELSNQLFRNLLSGFQPVSSEARVMEYSYTAGVTSGDVNQDGWPDLVVGNLGTNRMLINQGDGTFRDVTSIIGWDVPSNQHYTMGLGIADISGDHLPDVVEINYVNDPKIFDPLKLTPEGHVLLLPGPLHYAADTDQVWIQSASQSWDRQTLGSIESSEQPLDDSAISATTRLGDAANPGLGLIVSNLDSEPGLEMFVANDARPNQLWKKKGAQDHFEDIAVLKGCAFSSRGEPCACMGVAMADFDGNQTPDLMITNWIDEWINMYLLNDEGTYRDLAPRYGLDRVSEGLLGFGCQPIDFDNNRFVDVMILNGHIEDLSHKGTPFEMPAQLLVNRGDRFEVAEHADDQFWSRQHVGRCLITADYNRDGKMDALAADLLEPVALLENQTETNHHWLQLVLVGTTSERDAIGARVTIRCGVWTQVIVTATGDGYQGRNESGVACGLGDCKDDCDVEIIWPSGKVQTCNSLKPDARYLVIENELHAFIDSQQNAGN